MRVVIRPSRPKWKPRNSSFCWSRWRLASASCCSFAASSAKGSGGLQRLRRRRRRREVVRRLRRRRQGRVWLLRRRVPERHVVLHVRVSVVRRLLQGRGQGPGPCDAALSANDVKSGGAIRGKEEDEELLLKAVPAAPNAECVPRRAEGGPDQRRLLRLAEQLVRRLRLPQPFCCDCSRVEIDRTATAPASTTSSRRRRTCSGAASRGRSVAAGGKGGAGGSVSARKRGRPAAAHAVAAHRAARALMCARTCKCRVCVVLRRVVRACLRRAGFLKQRGNTHAWTPNSRLRRQQPARRRAGQAQGLFDALSALAKGMDRALAQERRATPSRRCPCPPRR